LAFFSPLPPAKTGIADYSAALLDELSKIAEVTPFSWKPRHFDPSRFDIPVYQIGNNVLHDFCYEMALEYPGAVVIHEADLHHLIANLTINRGDWDSYLREVEFDSGPLALAFAQRTRAGEPGADCAPVPMLRRLLSRSKAAIVHSDCVCSSLRSIGFEGPVARIPHGTWFPEVNREEYRQKLGLNETTPLVGTFGFLRPYKRIAESLRAFRRLLRLQPHARMILGGEAYSDFPVEQLIRSMDLDSAVRVLGFIPIQDFAGYIAACDVVLNLRFPTAGENSGTLMRSFGLGKAVIVSDVGSYSEFPDDVCLKVPVGSGEDQRLFEYLNVLVSRPALARELGERARQWVQTECRWASVAQRYYSFLESVAENQTG
jgi:glycosyltransferase involved in cell wall biosynthesis